MPQGTDGEWLLACTTQVVRAYAAGNKLTPRDLVAMVAVVADTLASLERTPVVPQTSAPITPEELLNSIRGGNIAARKPRRLTQAEIEASIQDRYLISFENGRTYFMMRRHLTAIGLTPDEYRAKWGLPEDYPVVAPYFARQRQKLAKRMSLGNHTRRPPDPSKDKRKFRLEGGVWITNTPTAAPRDPGADDPERGIPVPLGTGMLVKPEVAALAMAPNERNPAPLGTGVMATPEGVMVATTV